ncbi:unnamed protein product [Bursaphelenchus okinawaensis]|uniref:EGF-like domain-containing protein n=1 Tax=Bursaphelenchus okinawaensis TaxID=465554 RepID=A0A811LMC7_9BILA|nr:unnamed protein product [Bursaphelenchus okinawaensis]CAG9125054.1 unnamed protein product [Bursaphelenchus okinawaensis]
MDQRTLSPAAYLRCVAIGIGGMGYWTQNFCPAGMVFEFLSQQCKYPTPVNELQSNSIQKGLQLMNIAILNGSCTHGEQCIGGTVCDPIQGRCLCPYGTVANLETLSCTATPALGPAPKTSPPGESCANGEQCSGGSICVTSLWKCLCPQELENINGQCVQPAYNSLKVALHGACTVSAQCPDGSSCVNSQCLCVAPYVEAGGACVEMQKTPKTAGPGELCNHGEACQRGSVCDSKIPVCVCPPGTDLENGECVQVRTTLAALNTFYSKPTKSIESQKSYGKYGPQTPAYPNQQYINTPSQVIYPQPATMMPQTMPNTLPTQPTPPRAAPVSTRPTNPFKITSNNKVAVGQPCTLNADCTTDAYCNGNTTPPTCQCLSTHVEVNNKCEKILYPGQTGCTVDKQCQAAFPGTRCQNQQCVCPQGLIAKEQTCVVVKTLPGQPCDSTSKQNDCIKGAECIDSQCECISPLLHWKKKCVHRDDIRLHPHESMACIEQLDCPTGFICVHGACECSIGSKFQNGRCLKDSLIAMQYEPEVTTVVVNSQGNHKVNMDKNDINNENGIPTIKNNILTTELHMNNNISDPTDNGIDGEETSDLTNSMDSLLLSKQAAESLEKIFNVLIKMKLDSTDFNTDNSTGSTNDPSNYHPENFNTPIKAQYTPPLNNNIFKESFSKDKITKLEVHKNSQPSIKTKSLANSSSNQNVTTKNIKDNMNNSPDLSKLWLQDDSNEKYKEFSLNPRKIDFSRKKRSSTGAKIVGEPCLEGDICLNGTSCINGTCSCPAEYEMKSGKCRRIAKIVDLNQRCDPAVDECRNGAACRRGICACVDGALEQNQQCRQRVGGSCVHGEQCTAGAECDSTKKKCECPRGFTEEKRKCIRQLASVGESCEDGELCTGSLCKNGKCECASEDYEIMDGKCVRVRLVSTNMENTIHHSPPKTTKIPMTTTQKAKVKNKPKTISKKIEKPTKNKGKKMSSLPIPPPMLATAKPGQMCADGEACIGGSICKDGICSCSDEEIIIDDKCVSSDGEALQAIERITKSAPGQLCTDDTICTGNSICIANVCVCPEGATLFQKECLKRGRNSDLSTLKSQSTLFNVNALDAIDSAVKTVVPGAMCKLSLECPYRTECIRGVCRCQRGETIVNGMCRKAIHEVPPGGRCDAQKGLDCVGESHCFYGICVCLYGLVTTAHECASSEVLKVADPGESCELSQQCGGGSECISGICECPKDKVLDQEKSQCLSKPLKGFFSYPDSKSDGEKPDNLIYGNPDDIPQSRFNQILSAKQMSINVVDLETLKALIGGQFTKLAGAGEKCDDTYCTSGARCVRGLCQCPDGYQDENGYCQPADQNSGNQGTGSNIGQPNEEYSNQQEIQSNTVDQQQPYTQEALYQQYQQQQQLQNMLYQQQLYGQAPMYIPGNGYGSGMFPALPGAYCSPNTYCYGGSSCNNGICMCRPGYRPINGACQVQRVALGDQCAVNEQCVTNGICQDGICSCGRGVHFHHRHRCPERVTARPGEECNNNQVCSFNSVCSTTSGVCECPVGLETSVVQGSGECVTTARPRGTICMASSQCHKNSYCDNGFCMCKAGFVVGPDGICLPQPKAVVEDVNNYMSPEYPPSAPAINFHPKTIEAMYSRKKLVAPPEMSSEKRLHLVMTSAPGEFCATTKLCSGNAVCVHGYCKCPEGMKVKGRRCVAKVMRRDLRRSPYKMNPMEIALRLALNDSDVIKEINNKQQGVDSHKNDEKLNFEDFHNGNHAFENMKNYEKEASEVMKNLKQDYEANNHAKQDFEGLQHERQASEYQKNLHHNNTGLGQPQIMHSPPKKFQKHEAELVQPFSRCDLKKQCVEGATCVSITSIGKVCICDKNRIFFMGICIKKRDDILVAQIGERCNIQHICENGSECVRGICKCPPDRREKAGFCLREAKPGESCQHDEFCAPNSVCRTEVGACVCPVGSSATDAGCTRNSKTPYPNTKEIKNAQPGQLCDTNLKCTNGSRCTGFGFCECPQNYALVHSMCIEAEKVRKPGEQCSAESTICTENSWCKDGWCRCLNKQHPHDGKCGFTYLDVNVAKPSLYHPPLTGNYLSHLPKHENGDEYTPNKNPVPVVINVVSNGPFGDEPGKEEVNVNKNDNINSNMKGNMNESATIDAFYRVNQDFNMKNGKNNKVNGRNNNIPQHYSQLSPQNHPENKENGFYWPNQQQNLINKLPRNQKMDHNYNTEAVETKDQSRGQNLTSEVSKNEEFQMNEEELSQSDNFSIFEPILDSADPISPLNSVNNFDPHNPVLIPHFVPTTIRPRAMNRRVPLKQSLDQKAPMDHDVGQKVPLAPLISPFNYGNGILNPFVSLPQPVPLDSIPSVEPFNMGLPLNQNQPFGMPRPIPLNPKVYPFHSNLNSKPTKMPLPFPGNDHIKVFKLRHKCSTSTDCPIGSYCQYSRCFCDNLPLRNTTRVTAGTCRTSQDCIEPLNCVGGMCICVPAATASSANATTTAKNDIKVTKPKKTDYSLEPKRPTTGRIAKKLQTTSVPEAPLTVDEEIEEEMEEYEDFSEEERVTESPKRHAKTTTPILPPAYVKCNQTVLCALDAECRRGRCVCIDPMKRLTIREKKPVCEYLREKFPTTTPDPIEEVVTRPPMPGEIGWKCEFSAQCNRRLTCVQGVCTCVSAVDNPCGHDFKGRIGGTTAAVPTVQSGVEKKYLKRPKREKMTEIPPGGSCAAGEKCVGGSVCHRGWCVCPDPLMVIYGGECRKPTYQQVSAYNKPPSSSATVPTTVPTQSTPPPTVTQPVQQQVYGSLAAKPVPQVNNANLIPQSSGNLLQPRTILPGKQCGPLDKCTGGSVCISGYCLCPSGMAPDNKGICKPRSELNQKPILAEVQHQSNSFYPSAPAYPLRPIPLAYSQHDECTQIGLHCKGGTICINRSCQCPMDKVLMNDECVPLPPKASLDECRYFHSLRSGKSTPASHALLNSPFCRKLAYSRWPRKANKIYKSTYDMISELVYARPTESCEGGQVCTGGAVCQDKKRCMCPPDKPIIRNFICIRHPNSPPEVPNWACNDSKKCPENSSCDGKDCKCNDGYVKSGDKCVMMPRDKNGAHVGLPPAKTQPTQTVAASPPVSNVLTPSEVLKIQQARLQQYAMEQQSSPSNVVRLQPRAVPRISGPRLQRPKPEAKTKKELGSENAVANCPPGVAPLYDDDSGRLRICNGMEPHCPPKSYCYVTGMASADYNCCRV